MALHSLSPVKPPRGQIVYFVWSALDRTPSSHSRQFPESPLGRFLAQSTCTGSYAVQYCSGVTKGISFSSCGCGYTTSSSSYSTYCIITLLFYNPLGDGSTACPVNSQQQGNTCIWATCRLVYRWMSVDLGNLWIIYPVLLLWGFCSFCR